MSDTSVAVAIGLNMIWDIIDSIKESTGVELTVDNIKSYGESRKELRKALNIKLGITES